MQETALIMDLKFAKLLPVLLACLLPPVIWAQASGETLKSPYDPQQVVVKPIDSLKTYTPPSKDEEIVVPEPIRIEVDSSSVESVIRGFHAVINSAGSQDADLKVMHRIFAADARMIMDFMVASGHDPMVVVHPAIFMLEFGPTLRQTKIRETVKSVQVEEAGRIATAIAVSEIEFFIGNGYVPIRAISFYHLLRYPQGWKILEVIRAEESDTFQIPAKYLN